MRWPRAFVCTTIFLGAATIAAAAAQDNAAKKPNVAVSGCLLRQGYATLVVDDARVDGKGDAAATAQPSIVKAGEPLTAPPRWILEGAGTLAQNVGARVQVLGVSDWVANPDDYPIPTGEPGPAPPAPRIEVISLKVVAPACS